MKCKYNETASLICVLAISGLAFAVLLIWLWSIEPAVGAILTFMLGAPVAAGFVFCKRKP